MPPKRPPPPERALGVDVSHWHPLTERTVPLVLDAGVVFLGVKATEGATFLDLTFPSHRALCRQFAPRLSLSVFYHFARPGSAVAQAEHLLRAVGPLERHERLCLDLEGTPPDAPEKTLAWIEAFYNRIEREHPGRQTLIYTSSSVWESFGNPEWARSATIALWAPRYSKGMTEPTLPRPWGKMGWHFWQWTDGVLPPFVIPGAGSFDASFFRGDEAALRKWVEAGEGRRAELVS